MASIDSPKAIRPALNALNHGYSILLIIILPIPQSHGSSLQVRKINQIFHLRFK